MKLRRFIGDVHGKFDRYREIIRDSPPSIQVGDMGVGFRNWPHGEPRANPPHGAMVDSDARFIRGNHDNPHACKNQSQFIPDGHYEDEIMFIGGAVSIDKANRVEDFSWWPEEELSWPELYRMVDLYIERKPRIMVTHECPESVAEAIVGQRSGVWRVKLDPEFSSRTRQAFQSMFSCHSPNLWIFGHWHVPFDHVINGTRFICLPELAYLDIDIDLDAEAGSDKKATKPNFPTKPDGSLDIEAMNRLNCPDVEHGGREEDCQDNDEGA